MSNRSRWIGLLPAGIALSAVIVLVAVGGRGPEPRVSEPLSETAPALTPRPPVVGSGVEVAPLEGARVTPRLDVTPRAEASAVVTQQALTAVATTTAVDAVPATPPPTARLPPPFVKPAEPTPVISKESASQLNQGVYEAEAIAAIAAAFPASEQATAYRVSRCETGGTFWPWAAEPGGHHFGIFQVDPSIWGAVPADIEGQARQAAGIVAAHGWSPWSCY